MKIELTAEQMFRIKAYWQGCIKRRATEEIWARGQMDGFERAINILTGEDPFEVIEAASRITPTERE